jgi:hypothetical protein
MVYYGTKVKDKLALITEAFMTELDDRTRDEDGTIRRKRSDTKVKTLREIYGPNFAPGTRSDARLGALLDRTGAESLDDYLKNHNE